MTVASKKSLALASVLASALYGQQLQAAVTIQYNPVVEVVAGTNINDGYTTSIDLFTNTQTGQTASAALSYNNTGSVQDSRLVTTAATSGGNLNNNPALVDAAESGQLYTGAVYAYSAGFDAVTGSTYPGESGNNNDRVVGAASLGAGTINSVSILAHQSQSNAYLGTSTVQGSINAAVGDDSATNLWTAGAIGTGAGGNSGDFQYFNTPVKIGAGSSAIAKDVVYQGGYLFGDTQTGGLIVFNQNPPPTTALTPTQLFTVSGPNPDGFALLDDPNNASSIYGINTAYVAVSGIGTLGIEKWVYNGTTWTDEYTIHNGTNTSTAYYGLAGQYDPASAEEILYATTATGTTSGLYQFEDALSSTTNTSADGSFIKLATAATNTQFQGVALDPIASSVPEPASLLLLGMLGVIGASIRRPSRKRAFD